MARQQAEALADRLFGMGAATVYAFGGGMTMPVAVELPDDPAKRTVPIDWYRNPYDEDAPAAEKTRDVGQRYLLAYTRL